MTERRPTPNCTPIRRSAFSTAAAIPRSWWPRRTGLGLAALALTDHDGIYGVPQFAQAARPCGLPTVFGTEVKLAPAGPRTGAPDPAGRHLLVLARDPEGYRRLCAVDSRGPAGGRGEGPPVFTLDALAAAAAGPLGGADRVPQGGGARRADGGRARGRPGGSWGD